MLILLLLTVIAVSAADLERNQLLNMCNNNNALIPCGLGWYRLNENRCIRAMTGTVAPFDIAELFCTREGGHLVSISNEAEYNRVLCSLVRARFTRDLYWIGARKQQGHYQWIDGSGPLTFTKWAPGQSGIPQKDCVEANFAGWGLWKDESCSENRLFVCERSG